MEIVSRTEQTLHRVEIEFAGHRSNPPSRKAVIEMVRGLEPGANPDLVVVKDCNTRFGMAMTTAVLRGQR